MIKFDDIEEAYSFFDKTIEKSEHSAIHNVYFSIDNITEEKMTLETDLFSKAALVAYAKKNCEERIDSYEMKFFTDYRGGTQGDYSMGMSFKIENVIDCLTQYPESKRAVIQINNKRWHHHETDKAKCLRELHFFLTPIYNSVNGIISSINGQNGWKLNCNAFYRAQAVDIMPKNVYFSFKVMNKIKKGLEKESESHIMLGSYSQFVTTMVRKRTD